jgi:hypothetical protein
VQAGQQLRAQIHLGVDRVVVRDDRQADRGSRAVVVDHRRVVRAVDIRRQQQHGRGTRLSSLLDPAAALQRTVRAGARHHAETLGGGFDSGSDDAGAFLVAERLVLT